MISSPHHLKNSQSQVKFHSGRIPFSPCLTKTLSIKEESKPYLGAGISVYNQRHNMIIASPADKVVHFYDADTLLPVKGRDKLKLRSAVTRVSFRPAEDFYIFGCSLGDIYIYNVSDKRLIQVKSSQKASVVLSIAFISSVYYAFSTFSSKGIAIGSGEDMDLSRVIPQNDDSYSLYCSKNQRILFSGLGNGDMVVYRTDQLPKLSSVCSVKAHRNTFLKIEGAKIGHKEYIITCGMDYVIRIWHLIKGRMKLIRTLIIGEMIHGLAYLEEYKMIAVPSGRFSDSVKFYSLMSGKLKFTLDYKMTGAKHIFVINDKNAIGVTDFHINTIKIVQLGEY